MAQSDRAQWKCKAQLRSAAALAGAATVEARVTQGFAMGGRI